MTPAEDEAVKDDVDEPTQFEWSSSDSLKKSRERPETTRPGEGQDQPTDAEGATSSRSISKDRTPTGWPQPPIRGLVPRVRDQSSSRRLLSVVRPTTALIDIVQVRRLLKRGETAATWFPDRTTVISTTTVADNVLSRISPLQEAAMIKAFGPDYHLPADFPVFADMAPEDVQTAEAILSGELDRTDGDLPEWVTRHTQSGSEDLAVAESEGSAGGTIESKTGSSSLSRTAIHNHVVESYDHAVDGTTQAEQANSRLINVKRCALGTLVLADHLDATSTEVIPLIKGTTPGERAICERVALEIGAPMVAKYVVQYYRPGGGQFPAIRHDVRAIHRETAGFPLLLIGCVSLSDGVPGREFTIDTLPESVVATCGESKVSDILRANPEDDALRDAYLKLDRQVQTALGGFQHAEQT